MTNIRSPKFAVNFGLQTEETEPKIIYSIVDGIVDLSLDKLTTTKLNNELKDAK